MTTLDRLAVGKQVITGAVPPHHALDDWAIRILTDLSPGSRVNTGPPGPLLPDYAVRYAQGCLEQRRQFQEHRLPAPQEGEA